MVMTHILGFRITDLHRVAVKIFCKKNATITFMGVTSNSCKLLLPPIYY